MYVRWKKYRLIKKGGYSFQAVLIKGVRSGNKMKQHYVQYLGSIRQQRLDNVPARIIFWGKVDKKLSTLNLEPEVKQAIVNKIHKRIAKPTRREIREINDFVAARRKAKLAQRNQLDDI